MFPLLQNLLRKRMSGLNFPNYLYNVYTKQNGRLFRPNVIPDAEVGTANFCRT